jgi:acylphosphatase
MISVTVVFEDPKEALDFFKSIMVSKVWDGNVAIHIHGDIEDMDSFHEFMTQDTIKAMIENIEEYLEEREQM